MADFIVTPVGRLVSGHPIIGQDKDFENRPYTTNDGQPRLKFSIGLAIPKAEFQPLYEKMYQAAAEGFPHLFANGQTPTSFSWKFEDGDDPKHANKTGWAGCYVCFFSTWDRPVQCFGPDASTQIFDENEIKRGYYGRASVSFNGNGQKSTNQGIYANLHMYQQTGYGEVINSGPSGEQVFGSVSYANPTGATSQPPVPSQMQPPAPNTPPVPTPAAPTAPAAPTPPAPVAPPATPVYVHTATDCDEAGYIQAGWNHEQLVANGKGYMQEATPQAPTPPAPPAPPAAPAPHPGILSPNTPPVPPQG